MTDRASSKYSVNVISKGLYLPGVISNFMSMIFVGVDSGVDSRKNYVQILDIDGATIREFYYQGDSGLANAKKEWLIKDLAALTVTDFEEKYEL